MLLFTACPGCRKTIWPSQLVEWYEMTAFFPNPYNPIPARLINVIVRNLNHRF